ATRIAGVSQAGITRSWPRYPSAALLSWSVGRSGGRLLHLRGACTLRAVELRLCLSLGGLVLSIRLVLAGLLCLALHRLALLFGDLALAIRLRDRDVVLGRGAIRHAFGRDIGSFTALLGHVLL